MSVAKVSEISATSSKSFEDAIQLGLARAGKTLRGIQAADKGTARPLRQWTDRGVSSQYDGDFRASTTRSAGCGVARGCA